MTPSLKELKYHLTTILRVNINELLTIQDKLMMNKIILNKIWKLYS